MRTIFAIVALAGWSLCGNAYGQECNQTIEGNDLLQYSLSEIRVSADCGEVTITLRHVGQLPVNAMGHNWVLTATADAAELNIPIRDGVDGIETSIAARP